MQLIEVQCFVEKMNFQASHTCFYILTLIIFYDKAANN